MVQCFQAVCTHKGVPFRFTLRTNRSLLQNGRFKGAIRTSLAYRALYLVRPRRGGGGGGGGAQVDTSQVDITGINGKLSFRECTCVRALWSPCWIILFASRTLFSDKRATSWILS